MSAAAQQSACPACGGDGYMTIVPESRRARSVRKAVPVYRAQGALRREQLPENPRQLAQSLLYYYGDAAHVAEIFANFADVRSKHLSRSEWHTIAGELLRIKADQEGQ